LVDADETFWPMDNVLLRTDVSVVMTLCESFSSMSLSSVSAFDGAFSIDGILCERLSADIADRSVDGVR
jgi:hypothetical protein